MASKAIYWMVAVLGIAVASGAAWWLQSKPRGATRGDGGTAQAAVQPASGARAVAGVEVARVVAARLQYDAQAVGTLRSRQSVMLRPEVAGRVLRLGFADGARVRRGQLLVQLDDALQRAEMSQAQAQLSIARANFKRNQELVAQDFVAQRVLDESAANLQVAEAQLALAQARLARMALVAPFDATAGIRLINPGDFVREGADLVNLEDTGAMLVDFRLPERFQERLERGQTAELQLDAMPGRRFSARIEALDPLLDANGRSVAVRAVLQQSDAVLRPGMFARVNVVFSVNPHALVLPEEAIVPQAGRQYVVKVVAAPAGSAEGVAGVSRRQEVQLGGRVAGKVEITAGLAAGDTVVVAGQQRLQVDGSPVRVVTPEVAAPASAPASR